MSQNKKTLTVQESLQMMKRGFASVCGQQQAAIVEEYLRSFDTMVAIIGEQQTQIFKLQNLVQEYEAMLPKDVLEKIRETHKSGGDAKVVVHPQPGPNQA